jgi:hypothetical protein
MRKVLLQTKKLNLKIFQIQWNFPMQTPCSIHSTAQLQSLLDKERLTILLETGKRM